MLKNIPLEEAQTLLLDKVQALNEETVDILESLGRILAQDIYAQNPIPAFERSPLDGYALRAQDIQGASQEQPAILKVIGEVPAGHASPGTLEPNTAIKIMTGAPIPAGADVVVRKEDTHEENGKVKIYVSLPANSNIICAGEDVQAGEKVLPQGLRLHAGAVGLLAALGVRQVPVFRKPKVALLCTGEELVDVGEPLPLGKIYNSNLYGISSAIKEAGGQPFVLNTVHDAVEAIAEKLQQGLEQADLVLSTGGASVGDYDLIYAAYKRLEASVLFQRVAMKPGTPALAAEKGGKLLIGLSGNPAAAFITFEHLVRPVLLKMGGRNTWQRPRVKGIMAEDFPKRGGPRRFLRSQVHWEEGAFRVYLSGKQNSGVLKSILHCNALVDVPENSPPLKAGQEVDVILLWDKGM